MSLSNSRHKSELREAGWHSRGYLPHFDGREVSQFVSLHLFDSVPASVIRNWKRQLNLSNSIADRILLQRRIERYLDQGYGQAFMKEHQIASTVQDVLLRSDGESYRLSAWVIMPNHIHMLATRFAEYTLAEIMQSLKSITSHKANQILGRALVSFGCLIILIATSETRNTFSKHTLYRKQSGESPLVLPA